MDELWELLHSKPTERFGEDDDEDEDEEKDEKPEPKAGKLNLVDLKLLKARTILVATPVNDALYSSICARVLYLEQVAPKEELTIVVNSPGGSADIGFGIYDLLKFVSCPVRSLCAGLCASAAVLIHLGSDKKRRFMLPHSRFLLHQPSTAVTGQASDMEISAREIIRLRERYAEIVAVEIGTEKKKVLEDSKRDFWLNAEEALKYGLVDKVTASRSEM